MSTFAMNLNIFIHMKKIILLLLAGFMMFPPVVNAKKYEGPTRQEDGEGPVRTLDTSYVNLTLNKTTGLLTMYFIGNVGNVEMTISQNGTVIDYDCFAGSNGGTETYSFASYAVGEYLLTLETENGSVSQYIITVEDD